jgi:hypothetical protein
VNLIKVLHAYGNIKMIPHCIIMTIKIVKQPPPGRCLEVVGEPSPTEAKAGNILGFLQVKTHPPHHPLGLF